MKSTLKRNNRLTLDRKWIPNYEGKHLVRGYRKHFKVSMLEAVKDLKILGYRFTDEYVNDLKRDQENRARNRRERKEKAKIMNGEFFESNEYFYYIAGYTDSGVPFGITWEEVLSSNLFNEEICKCEDIEDLPF